MEVILDKIMYEDLQNAKKINNIIDVIMALEKANGDPLILEKLKKSIGYEKDGRVKRHVNFYEIAPLVRLVPPGTLGFENKEAI